MPQTNCDGHIRVIFSHVNPHSSQTDKINPNTSIKHTYTSINTNFERVSPSVQAFVEVEEEKEEEEEAFKHTLQLSTSPLASSIPD